MTKDELKNRISMALKDPILQQGFEIICKENVELKTQIEKMKCCENCKYSSYWGDEVHCNYGFKEALIEDRLVECENMEKWEIWEIKKIK